MLKIERPTYILKNSVARWAKSYDHTEPREEKGTRKEEDEGAELSLLV